MAGIKNKGDLVMKKLLLSILTLALIVSMTACANKADKTSSPARGTPSTQSEDSNGADQEKDAGKPDSTDNSGKIPDETGSSGIQDTPDMAGDTDVSDPAILESLQKAYGKAPEYEYMALGYYQDLFRSDMVRDGYVPYEENYVQERTDSIRGKAHGISIRLHMAEASGATAAAETLKQDYFKRLEERYLVYETDEITSYDNDTLAICPVAYMDENEHPVITFLYTDIRDNGAAYMCAEIEFYTAEFDDTTVLMLPEVEDIFALNFSGILGFDKPAGN